MQDSNYPGRYWHLLEDGRMQCDLCPRDCRLHEGQRGACFVRMREGQQMILTTYGRSSGFCIDPIEKKPLNNFHPGSSILSFGTAGCNLACRFCQNWDISKSKDMDRLMDTASPRMIADAARRYGADAVAYTYQQDGHPFYVLNFPSANTTWVYDVSTGAWHERAGFQDGAFVRHRANCQCNFGGEIIVGDHENGNIYALDMTTFAGNGEPQKWLRSWRALPPGHIA